MPNPPVPNEIKRRRGTYRKDRHAPQVNQVIALPMADGVPQPPADLELDGRQLWGRVWQEGLVWISPQSDIEAVVQTCRLVDDIAIARERYRVTRDPADGRMVATFSSELTSSLSALGFNPTARSRLGVAEVKVASKLDALRRQQDKGLTDQTMKQGRQAGQTT